MRTRILPLVLLVAAACSDNGTAPVQPGAPQVETRSVSAMPELPADLDLSGGCYSGPDSGVADQCPVLVWGPYTYWALSYGDNRSALAIVAFDDAGNVAQIWERTGARYNWQITVDEQAETVSFWGQTDHMVVLTWDELRL